MRKDDRARLVRMEMLLQQLVDQPVTPPSAREIAKAKKSKKPPRPSKVTQGGKSSLTATFPIYTKTKKSRNWTDTPSAWALLGKYPT